MDSKYLGILLFASSLLPFIFCQNALSSYETVFAWKQLDFSFPDQWNQSAFISENNIIAGVKIHQDKMFLTVPRWRHGVPATLNFVHIPAQNQSDNYTRDWAEDNLPTSPKLQAYPSWAMQTIGNCSAFQYVQSIEIDLFDRMWAFDVGRVDIFDTNKEICPPKLVILDLLGTSNYLPYSFPHYIHICQGE